MQAPRHETGVRLIFISIVVALLTAAVLPLLSLSVAGALSTDSPQAYWWHAVVIPGIALALIGTFGVAGLGGILIVEWNRGHVVGQAGQIWDRIRITALVSILSGAFLFVSGLVLGLIYLAEYRALFAMQVAVQTTLAITLGLFLFWTAKRTDPTAKRLRQVAFLLGAVAAGISATTGAASFLGWMSADPVVGGTIAALAKATGTLSLVVWVIVYGGILARSRSSDRTSAASA